MLYMLGHRFVSGVLRDMFRRLTPLLNVPQAYASKEAERLGVVGWITNTSRGSVEGEIQGEPDKVAKMKVCSVKLSPNAHSARIVLTSALTVLCCITCLTSL